ncbi:uncharacterized protein LOC135943996 [Cloeon dipterum]|uniref:uncharacterized protein LOC135943996 n=1 Tax=Cloeon dipterum TaxID=197152 RepID=UPI00322055B2
MSLCVSSLCLILLGLSFQTGGGVAATELHDDFRVFFQVVSIDDVTSPFLYTYQETPEFARSVDFLVSREYDQLLDELFESIYFEEYRDLLMENGVPMQVWMERFRALTHAPPFPARSPLTLTRAGLDKDFMPFIYNMMPYIILTDITDVYFYLSRTSRPFMAFLQFLASDEHQNTLGYLIECPQFQALWMALLENGIDLQEIFNYFSKEIAFAQDF